ncbi:MAG TPA: thioredoxin family protein, partial [Planctomicrobium sp.]|nr:thioredoxin family protein [Planctomicrobium sp.]
LPQSLPVDVLERVDRDFGNAADAVSDLLLACRRIGSPDYIGDRLLLCLVFAARGDESRIRQLMELARQDFRDVVMAAEYDELGLRRLRDFNQPFGSADILEPERSWSPSTPDVRGHDVDELCRQHSAIAIHFWATWNRVDREMDRSIQNIVDQFAGRVRFVSCEIDLPENLELCQRFGVSNIPALGLLVSDCPPQLVVGCREPKQLAAEIERLLKIPERKSWWEFWRWGHIPQ